MFVWHHHSLSITQYFSHYLWAPYLSLGAVFSFFFSLVPKLTEPSKKKKDPEQTEPVKEEEEKKKESNSQPRRRKEKKKSKGGQKLRLSTVCEPPMCV